MAKAFNKYYCDKHIMFLCVSVNTAFSYISLSLSVFPLLVYLSSLQLQTCCKILSLSLSHTHTHTHTHQPGREWAGGRARSTAAPRIRSHPARHTQTHTHTHPHQHTHTRPPFLVN